MPRQAGRQCPDAVHVAAYLAAHLADYEKRYDLPVQRSVRVERIGQGARGLTARTAVADITRTLPGQGGTGCQYDKELRNVGDGPLP